MGIRWSYRIHNKEYCVFYYMPWILWHVFFVPVKFIIYFYYILTFIMYSYIYYIFIIYLSCTYFFREKKIKHLPTVHWKRRSKLTRKRLEFFVQFHTWYSWFPEYTGKRLYRIPSSTEDSLLLCDHVFILVKLNLMNKMIWWKVKSSRNRAWKIQGQQKGSLFFLPEEIKENIKVLNAQLHYFSSASPPASKL